MMWLKKNDLWCFLRKLIHFTQGLELFRQEKRLEVTYTNTHHPYISWHGTKLKYPDWSYYSRCLAFSIGHTDTDEHLHVMLNAYWESLEFELPLLGHGNCWHRIIDTASPLSKSFYELDAAYPVKTQSYHVQGRSSVVLMVKPVS